MPKKEFVKKCLSTTARYIDEFRELWQSLGFSVDWSLQYETIGPKAQRISQRSFVRLFKEGKAYMKESPVLWCTECRTSIAQAELETAEKQTSFNYIPFETTEGDEKLIIATTRRNCSMDVSACSSILMMKDIPGMRAGLCVSRCTGMNASHGRPECFDG